MALINFINQGGPINWFLCFLFFICLVQIVERVIYFVHTKSDSPESQLLRLQKKAESLSSCSAEVKEKELQKEAAYLIHEMERGLWNLNFIGEIAPSIGLLGTVTGLIGCFKDISTAQTSLDITNFSGGIWEAMLTTATGMIIAIPTLFSYRVFTRIIEKRTSELSLYGDDKAGTNGKNSRN